MPIGAQSGLAIFIIARNLLVGLDRIAAGRFRPASAFDLSHAIVSALARNQEAFVEVMTSARFYGMNFDHMPELHWTLGYPSAVILMLLLSVALYIMFKRRHWL